VKFGIGRRPDPLVDVTPMIDIVFQLVLFFMVSTTFVNAPGIQVDLPRSSAQVVITDSKDLSIWMTCGTRIEGGACKDGAIFVNDRPVSADRLQQIFENAASHSPDTLVVIKADQGVQHGKVVTVMDLARTVGLTRLAIATEVVEDEGDTR